MLEVDATRYKKREKSKMLKSKCKANEKKRNIKN
jgi:hypothetical protein